MTYSSGGLIQAADYNSLATTINGLWGTGSGNSGYGQSTTLTSVAGGSTVNIASTEWAAAVSRVNSMTAHQIGSSYTPSAGTPTSGGIIKYLSDFNTALTACSTNKNSFAANGTDSTTNYDNSTGWYTSSQREVSITFSSGDAARYFFNAGGQIRVSFSLTGGDNAKSTDWATLCSNVGTLVIGANGFSQVGGGGNAPSVYNTAIGYYGCTTSYQTLHQQYSTGSSASYYANNYIQFQIKSNGTVGSNSDKGSVVSINANFIDAAVDSTWPQIANTPNIVDEVHGTLRMAVTIRPPETTYLSNTWGTPTLAQVTNTAVGQTVSTSAATRSFTNNITTSPWNLDTNGAFAINGSNAWYMQPLYDFKAEVYIWGAGGGGGNTNYGGMYPAGGPGGFAYGQMQFKAGYTYYLRAGDAGGSAGSGGGAGFGGNAGSRGGAGGGYSGIFLNAEGFGGFVIAAGGGGGGANSLDNAGYQADSSGGGGGGGSSGGNAGPWPLGSGAGGGTQSSGGAGSTGGTYGITGGYTGYHQQGGPGQGWGAGGGGGYYGGGSGGYTAGGFCSSGGGGSGYINSVHVTGVTLTSPNGTYNSNYRNPQGISNSYYASGIAVGGYQSSSGGVGRIVIL